MLYRREFHRLASETKPSPYRLSAFWTCSTRGRDNSWHQLRRMQVSKNGRRPNSHSFVKHVLVIIHTLGWRRKHMARNVKFVRYVVVMLFLLLLLHHHHPSSSWLSPLIRHYSNHHHWNHSPTLIHKGTLYSICLAGGDAWTIEKGWNMSYLRTI